MDVLLLCLSSTLNILFYFFGNSKLLKDSTFYSDSNGFMLELLRTNQSGGGGGVSDS